MAAFGPHADTHTNPLPGLLLLDLKMPRLNGFDVLMWLRDQPRLASLPVVVLIPPWKPTSKRPNSWELLTIGSNQQEPKPWP